MTPGLRRFTFTTHITSSVGWVGAVMVFLALAVVGLTSDDERTVRGAYLAMAPAAWFVLVPLAHASLLSGIALSLGTSWGLFRHYWVGHHRDRSAAVRAPALDRQWFSALGLTVER